MNLNHVEHGHAKGNCLLGAANAGCADADRPDVGDVVEMPRRTSSVRVRAFASHFIQTPTFTVPGVAVLLNKLARVEVRSARTLIVDVAVERELWAPLFV